MQLLLLITLSAFMVATLCFAVEKSCHAKLSGHEEFQPSRQKPGEWPNSNWSGNARS